MKDRHKNRTAHNKVDLTNQRFGKLFVLRETKNKRKKRALWFCLCNCGKTKEISSKYLLNGDTKSCGCLSKGNAHNRKAYQEITKSFWSIIEKSAKIRGIPFLITQEDAWNVWEKQNGRCALSDIKLTHAVNFRDQRSNHTASLDRIDSNLGYTINNIQWVHKNINIMKNKMSNSEFVEWCCLVQNYKGK